MKRIFASFVGIFCYLLTHAAYAHSHVHVITPERMQGGVVAVEYGCSDREWDDEEIHVTRRYAINENGINTVPVPDCATHYTGRHYCPSDLRWITVYVQDATGHQESCSKVFGFSDFIHLDHVFHVEFYQNHHLECHCDG